MNWVTHNFSTSEMRQSYGLPALAFSEMPRELEQKVIEEAKKRKAEASAK